MGYVIKIGNAVDFEVESVTQEKAPTFGNPTDYTNELWPSYTAWADFCKDTGLYDLFLNREADGALMRNHPGIALLTEEVRGIINATLAKRRAEAEALGKIAAYCEFDDDGFKSSCPEPCPSHDYQLCRLEWLAFWVNWAMDNCSYPVIQNW